MNTCSQCNERNPSTARACLHCGAMLAAGPPKKKPLFENVVQADGTIESRGPLATALAIVVVLGFAVLAHLIVTGKIELHESDEICILPGDVGEKFRLEREGYGYIGRNHRDHDCYRPRSPTPTEP